MQNRSQSIGVWVAVGIAVGALVVGQFEIAMVLQAEQCRTFKPVVE